MLGPHHPYLLANSSSSSALIPLTKSLQDFSIGFWIIAVNKFDSNNVFVQQNNLAKQTLLL